VALPLPEPNEFMTDSFSKPVFGAPVPLPPAKLRVRPLNRDRFRMLNIDVEI
jgi:hypothetical protein